MHSHWTQSGYLHSLHQLNQRIGSGTGSPNEASVHLWQQLRTAFEVDMIDRLNMQDWLTGLDLKFYESKINLNWKPILKSIMEVGYPGLPPS